VLATPLERHCTPREVPQDWAQCAQPLNA
jgi:hypothetical protein